MTVEVTGKSQAFEITLLQSRNVESCDTHHALRAVVKQAVKVAKRVANWRWSEFMLKMFRQEMKHVRKCENAVGEIVKESNGPWPWVFDPQKPILTVGM